MGVVKDKLIYTKELDFIPKLQLSKSRRAVYYTKNNFLEGKLPKKYLVKVSGYSRILSPDYYWSKDNYLTDTHTHQKPIKNSRTAGKARYWVINGQSIYNGAISPKSRAGLMVKLHEYFKEILKDCPKFNLKEGERYKVKYIFYLLEDKVYPDISNLWIYGKVINDVLVKDLQVVADDNTKYHKNDEYDSEFRVNEGFKIEIYKI